MTMEKRTTDRFFRYDPDANSFAGVGFETEESDDFVLAIHSSDTPLLPEWRVRQAFVFDDNPATEGDFPSVSNFRRVPLISERAWQALAPLVGSRCEALPIAHPSGRIYYFLHVMDTIDCLDVDASELLRSAIDGRVNRIYRYAFNLERLHDKHIFKLPLESGGELIVDDAFRRVVEENGLKGLRFKELPMS